MRTLSWEQPCKKGSKANWDLFQIEWRFSVWTMCILLWEQPCKKGKKCWTPNVNLRSAPNALFPRSGSLNPNMIGYLKKEYIIVIYFSSCQCYLRLDKVLTCQQQDLLYHHAMIGCSGKDKASVRSSSKKYFSFNYHVGQRQSFAWMQGKGKEPLLLIS